MHLVELPMFVCMPFVTVWKRAYSIEGAQMPRWGERQGYIVERFYWLIDGQLAGSSRPGGPAQGRRETGASPDTLDEDLSWLRRQGIGAVLTLTETPLQEDVVSRHGLQVLHLPIPDMQAPSPTELLLALGFIDRQRALGCGLVVHCLMGQGRTGTVLAAYLIRGGLSPEHALRDLRQRCPGAVGSTAQEQALHMFAARRDWIL